MSLNPETAHYWVVNMDSGMEYILPPAAGDALVALMASEGFCWVGRDMAGSDVVIVVDCVSDAYRSTPQTRAAQREVDHMFDDAEKDREPWEG